MSKEGKPFSQVAEDVQPLVRAISQAQFQWLVAQREKSAEGPYNEESFIALVAVAHAFGTEMMRRGATKEAIEHLADLGKTLGGYIEMGNLPQKGMDA